MKNKRLAAETILGILVGVVFFLYRRHMLEKAPDFYEKDFVYTMVLVPLFFFTLAYLTGRWVFHFTVCAVRPKGIRVLFWADVVIIGLNLVGIAYTGVVKYVFTEYTVTPDTYAYNLAPWMQGTFWEKCYVRIFAYGGSEIHAVICVFAGLLFALAVTGKKLAKNNE